MKFIETHIPEVIICEPQIHGDERGYFMESFRQGELESHLGYQLNFCQDNESRSARGVLRGLHYQLAPNAQTKLVRVIQGEVLDIAVDIREGSPTFGQHVAVTINDENKRQLFIPRGFAHGFVVLSETAVFSYKVDNYYAPQSDRGIAFNDPQLNIDWKMNPAEMKLSGKDQQQPLLENAELFSYEQTLYKPLQIAA